MEQYNILCLDDEKIVLSALKRELELNPAYRVSVADNPGEALNMALENYYDVYLIDQHMPEMDGVTFVRQLKEIEGTPLVFFLTGQDFDGKAYNAALPDQENGGAYYFTKPWNESLYIGLAQALKHCRERKRLNKENQKLSRWVKSFLNEVSSVRLLSEDPDLESKLDHFYERLLEREQVEEVDIFLLSGKRLEAMRSTHLRGDTVIRRDKQMALKAMEEGPLVQKVKGGWKYFSPFGIKEKKIGLVGLLMQRLEDENLQFIEYIIYQGGIMLEQELVQMRLQSALEDLETAQKELIVTEKSAFLSGLARWLMHHINNILCGLKGDTDLLQMAWSDFCHQPEVPQKVGSLTHQIAESLPAIDNSIQRLIQLIDNFRFFADISKAKTRRFDLNRLIQIALQNFISLKEVDPATVQIIEKYERTLELVEINRELLTRMLEELFIKALAALGGKTGTIEVRTRKQNGWVEILITDNGKDNSLNERQWLKEPLFSKDIPLEMSGMGLIIIKEAVNFHHGEIVFTSKMGQGSTVRIRLPSTPATPHREGKE